ncbi:MAG: TolB-like 6-bladed beta-propeller domain-containing protein [Prevotellaceae bacterium]|nr:TolB-like 6-bladed beta-propeller domain-containing protein [Prevotellaceae bacterium]
MKHVISKNVIMLLFAGSALFLPAQSPFVENAMPLHGEPIAVDCGLTYPFEMSLVNSCLIFADRYEGKTVAVFDTKAGKCLGWYIPQGSGAGEMQGGPMRFSSSDGKLQIYQPSSGNLYTFSVPAMKLQKTVSFASDPATGRQNLDQVRKLQDEYVGTGRFEKGRFCLYNKRGKEMRQTGEYPFEGESMDAGKRSLFYNGQIGASPEGTAFVVCSWLCDNLEFYEIHEKEVRRLKKYGTHDVDVSWRENRTFANENTLSGYIHVYETNNYCYLLYSGEKGLQVDGKWLFVFDWQGNHLKSYELDMSVHKFCVDEIGQILYGIVRNGDKSEIRSFKL